MVLEKRWRSQIRFFTGTYFMIQIRFRFTPVFQVYAPYSVVFQAPYSTPKYIVTCLPGFDIARTMMSSFAIVVLFDLAFTVL